MPRRRRPKYKLRALRKKGYKHNHALHRFEEDFVVRCLCVKPHSAGSLGREFPGRFNKRLLAKVFVRLRNRQRIIMVGMNYHGVGRGKLQHSSVFSPVYGPHLPSGYARRSGPRRKKLARG